MVFAYTMIENWLKGIEIPPSGRFFIFVGDMESVSKLKEEVKDNGLADRLLLSDAIEEGDEWYCSYHEMLNKFSEDYRALGKDGKFTKWYGICLTPDQWGKRSLNEITCGEHAYMEVLE